MSVVPPLTYAEPPDVPEGMTLAEYRRSRRLAPRRSSRSRRMVAALRARRRRAA